MTEVQMPCPPQHYHALEIFLVIINVSFNIGELALLKVLKSFNIMICMLLMIGIII